MQEITGKAAEEEHRAGDDYEIPHPEGIVSICYSCTEYETCNVKTGTCTKCDQYNNRKEAYKTEEQRYEEEQDQIDRETAKRLKEMEDEKKMETLPQTLERSRTYIRYDLRSPILMMWQIKSKHSNFGRMIEVTRKAISLK